jgi:hypothetical protein
MPHLIHTSHNPHKSTQIPPVIFPPPDPGGGTGFNLLKADFENGVFSPPFWNPWINGITVRNDPTPRAAGMLADIDYNNDPTNGNTDSNIALFPGTIQNNVPFTIGLNQELWFQGDFYFDTLGTAFNTQRKLTYWGWSGDTWGFQHPFSFVITSFNSVPEPVPPGSPLQVVISVPVVKADGTVISMFDGEGTGHLHYDSSYFLTLQTWHRLKIRIRPETAFGAQNGILKIIFDDTHTILDRTDAIFTSPDWTEDPNTYQWVKFGTGYQLDGSVHLTEHRYWDNISFATDEASL